MTTAFAVPSHSYRDPMRVHQSATVNHRVNRDILFSIDKHIKYKMIKTQWQGITGYYIGNHKIGCWSIKTQQYISVDIA